MLKTITQKKCSKCKDNKNFSLFSKDIQNKDKLRNQCKDCVKLYREQNKEKIEKNKLEYYKENKEKIAFRRNEYIAKNREKISKKEKEYRSTEKGKLSKINSDNKRRDCKRGSNIDTLKLFEITSNTKSCYWCNNTLKNKKIHLDHYVPLSKGGLHILSNIVISCSKCNLKKSARDPLSFANSIGKLL